MKWGKCNCELAFELEDKAQAQNTQSKDAISVIQAQLGQLNLAIDSLKKITFANPAHVNKTIMLPTNIPIAREWTDLTFYSFQDTSSADSKMDSSSSFSKTLVNFILAVMAVCQVKHFLSLRASILQ